MSETDSSQPILNRLLNALPPEVYILLLPNLKTVSLSLKEVLYEPGRPIDYVYFPNSGVVSVLTILSDGIGTEVAVVGNEGMVGISVFLGVDISPFKAIVQIPGNAMRMKASLFKAAVESMPLNHLLLHYTHTLMIQASQSAACNYHHTVEKRCCRWLLMLYDCTMSEQFPLTQEFLSQMLGVRRASVNQVASKLQKAGLISYTHGRVTIDNRHGLEEASCECYQIIKAEIERLFS